MTKPLVYMLKQIDLIMPYVLPKSKPGLRCLQYSDPSPDTDVIVKELYKLALESPPDLQLEVAEYFEKHDIFDKAIILYQKGGRLNRALDLCFQVCLVVDIVKYLVIFRQTNQFDSLASLTADMGSETPSDLIDRCASFFLESRQYDKTVQLYLTGRRYKEVWLISKFSHTFQF